MLFVVYNDCYYFDLQEAHFHCHLDTWFIIFFSPFFKFQFTKAKKTLEMIHAKGWKSSNKLNSSLLNVFGWLSKWRMLMVCDCFFDLK